MKYLIIAFLALFGALFSIIGCTKEPTAMEEEMEIDSFKNLTPCLIEIVKDYSNYVLNDTIPQNDDFELEQILRMEVDSMKYYWLQTNALDKTDIIWFKWG